MNINLQQKEIRFIVCMHILNKLKMFLVLGGIFYFSQKNVFRMRNKHMGLLPQISLERICSYGKEN